MRNSQGLYEPGQEKRGMPGRHAYDTTGTLRDEPIADRAAPRTAFVLYVEVPRPEWMPEEPEHTMATSGRDYDNVAGRLALSSAGAIAHPRPQDLADAVRSRDRPRTDAEHVAGDIWKIEATWDEVESGHDAGLYTWRALVHWLHATGYAKGLWSFEGAQRLCLYTTSPGTSLAYARWPWHE